MCVCVCVCEHDLASNNLQRLKCHKTQPTKQLIYIFPVSPQRQVKYLNEVYGFEVSFLSPRLVAIPR